ncbi:hypothetical protein ABZ319_22455 [Nocardia sp. NPDC005978]|uniref:hypothetical protein n=1 Tax=Nocardia sp. NPDC005978 TaxID=3156725 RepID=UPI0033A8FFFA
MIRIGLWLIVLGFGSVLLQVLDLNFVVLTWADDAQPVTGLAIGTLGLIIALVGAALPSSNRNA